MPFEFLAHLERERYQHIPKDPPLEDLFQFGQLSESDLQLIRQQRQPANRLGFGVQLTLIRWLHFLPEHWWKEVPYAWVDQIGAQLDIDSIFFVQYGYREETIYEHFRIILVHLKKEGGNHRMPPGFSIGC